MSGNKNTDFGYLDIDYQRRLLNQVLVDRKYAEIIIEILDPNYFSTEHLRNVMAIIKNAHDKHEAIPDFESLKARASANIKSETTRKFAIAEISRIQEINTNDATFIQEEALKFCKQQELSKSVREIQRIIDIGDLDSYDECVEIIQKALQAGSNGDLDISVTSNVEAVLADDFRKPVPTGIKGLDDLMNGGLGRAELGIILAPFGVGKTTMITKIANTAFEQDLNVLQIFFEDLPKVIQRKHYSCWTGYELNDLPNHKEEIIELVAKKAEQKGEIRLAKFSSDDTTIPKIRQYIKKKISQGFRPDVILLDYIDCVQPSKNYADANVAEGSIMRQFETMLSDFNIVGWTAIQGNRCCSLDTEVQTVRLGKCEIKDVIEGDEILTSIGHKKITNVFPITKQAVYRIKLKSGKEIKVSAKHEFPVKYGKLRSISTGLSVGDKLLTKNM
tara:strand:+ start:14743 stop:16080 length:1338 start_codon:yes stop_codon:yes gene_type:complete